MSALHFLVVDDDPTLQTLMVANLERIGVHIDNIETADDGRLALTKLRQLGDKTAVVITDLQMPNLDGYGLIETMCQDPNLRHLKVILTTAIDVQSDTRLLNFLRSHFLVYYLRKDEVTPEKLQTALQKIFGR